MKKILSVVFVMVSLQVFAQTNPITAITITLPSNPDALTANWGTGTSLFMISATTKAAGGRINPAVEESRILVLIKKDGNKFCGSYTGSTAVASGFNTITKVWSGSNAVSLLGKDCTLPPGDYELSVQFFGNGPVGSIPLSDEKTKPFTIKGTDQQAYQPPQAIAPANGSTFSETDIKKPMTFRWTPVIPKPQEPVTYRLSVWQLMQGQTGPQAIKANQPIITKDVDNITQALITNLITGPCKPPYLCEFVWNVQALTRDGKPIGGNNGASELSTFKFDSASPSETISSPILISPANGATLREGELPKFTWKGGGPGYKLKIIEVTGSQSSGEALGTNKPHFEKDSIQLMHTNKPFFEKDSIELMRTNKPFFEKDSLNELIFRYPASAPKFMAGKRYAWAVLSRTVEGKPIAGNKGTSGTNEFTTREMGTYGITVQNLTVECHKGADHNFTVNIGNPNNGTAIIDKLEIVSINGAVITPISATSVSPALGSMIAANGNVNVSASFSYASAMNVVCVKAYIKEQSNPLLNVASSYTCDTLKCCWPCDINQVTASNSSIVQKDAATGTVNIQNIITATPNNITKIVADLVYVKVTSVNNDCNLCNKGKKQQDNFIDGNFIVNGSAWKTNGNGAIAYASVNGITRSLTFTSTSSSGVNITSGIKISHTIGLSPTSCCGDVVEVWIRYSVWDNSCHVCDQLVKATLTRDKACNHTNGGTNGTVTNGKVPVQN